MKKTIQPLSALLVAGVYSLASCDKHDHDHAGGDHHHEKGGGHTHGDGDADHKHGKGDGDGHDHDHSAMAGPNGGRVLAEFEPHAEFFVQDDRRVRITFVDDDHKPVAPGEQIVMVIAGDRTSPTELSFAKDGEYLVSDRELPAGDDFPVVVRIKATAADSIENAKFQCNLKVCPGCDLKEYACVCDHDH